LKTLKSILDATRKELLSKDKTREAANRDLREATSLSKQAILLVHQKKLKEAQKLIEKARKCITKVNEASSAHPGIIYSGQYSDALQEYSEANIFLNLVQESNFITPNEIEAPPADYVLGLADVIGECRRAALDALREGNIKKGEHYLETMDQIYIQLSSLDESYMLVPGLRRKCDVARKLIEITRGDITQEISRNKLEKHLALLEKQVRKEK
jgi:translin